MSLRSATVLLLLAVGACAGSPPAPSPKGAAGVTAESAPKKVAIAGLISRKPKRTIRIDTSTAMTEKTARLRDHVASADTGSVW